MTATPNGATATVEPIVDDGDLTDDELVALDSKRASCILSTEPDADESSPEGANDD